MTPFGWRLMGSTVPGMGADQLTPVGTALAWLLIGVSAVDAATGRWLGQDRRRGRVVALATTPVNVGLGLLFQVPFLIVVPPLRAGLAIVARGDSRPSLSHWRTDLSPRVAGTSSDGTRKDAAIARTMLDGWRETG